MENVFTYPSPPYVKVNYRQRDIGRRTHYRLAFFKVMLQVTSDPDDSAELSCNDRRLFFGHQPAVPSSWGDEEGDKWMTMAVKTDSCVVCACVRVWKQYINTLLYWGASPNLHVLFFSVCVNETGIDMQTTQWWRKNNGGLSVLLTPCNNFVDVSAMSLFKSKGNREFGLTSRLLNYHHFIIFTPFS